MRILTNPRFLIATLVVGGLLAVALWPTTIPVETVLATRGPLVVTVDEEGVTRVRNRFVVSAAVAGRVLRIELEPGDTVKRGQVVARVQSEPAPLLDPRSRAEAEAAVESARASLGRARAEEQRARAAAAQAQRDLVRIRDLARDRIVGQQELETKEAEAKAAEESVNAAVYAVRIAASELQRAEARLAPAPPVASGRVLTVTSPADGVVLKRVRESESTVPAGEPLVEIGDPAKLEVVADLLSVDAVRVKPGTRAFIDQWGGQQPLEMKVRRIEPAGFTKISALGVEEQRVNVVLDFVDPQAAARASLGDGYRVEVHVVLWEAADVLKLPTSTLFRQGDEWAVYVVEDGRARAKRLVIGHQTGQEAEVLSGLPDEAVVIVHPGDTITDDVRVKAGTE